MTRFAKRTDKNHAEIRDALRKLGFHVIDLSACGYGIPDISVMIAPFISVFMEIKDGDKPPSAQALTRSEQAWMGHWSQHTRVVNSLESALQAIRDIKESNK